MSFEKLTVCGIRDGISTRKFTAREVAVSVFDRIEKKDGLLGGYLTLCHDRALIQADSIDERIKRGEEIGKLAGVPIAVKDNICTEGIRTTCASKMLEDFIPPYDATAVRRLTDSDAIIIGKTNMDEFAMGSSTENSAFKCTLNPWDTERVPGGSSGGSAAVVAAGMAAAALGSDTGGSIRQPAAFCGVVGMKPSYGSVSRYGLIAFGSSLEQIGPLTLNVKDNAVLLEALQGQDKLDSTSVRSPGDIDYLRSLEAGIKGMRIGVPSEFLQTGLEEEILNCIKNNIYLLRELGAIVEYISLPMTTEGLSAYYIISSAEASSNLARFDGIRYGHRTEVYDDLDQLVVKSRSEGFGEEVKRRIMLGTFALSSGYYEAFYKRAQKLRIMVKEKFSRAFGKHDLILGPTSPVLPFKFGEKSADPLKMYLSDIYTTYINLAGIPALSLPCGYNSSGLPIGLQLMGPLHGEMNIYKAAYALEQAHIHEAGRQLCLEGVTTCAP